jgi:replicative DNA helicase
MRMTTPDTSSAPNQDYLLADRLPEGLVSASHIAGKVLERCELRRNGPLGLIGLSTGLEGIDLATDGLEPGDFILLASRVSMGKSALSLQICSHIAIAESKSVAIFSYDHGVDMLGRRLIANQAQIENNSLRNGNPEVRSKVESGVEELAAAPIVIDAPCQKTLDELVEGCKELKNRFAGLTLIAVDGIQGMLEQSDCDIDGTEISNALKNLAVETQTSVIATTQLSRELESRRDKHPRLRDLRRWGRLDYAADVVLGLYRESYYDPNTREQLTADLAILKNAKGCLGTIELRYDASCGRFNDRPFRPEK